MLCLAGWVEYPYSQTNYAAATAGVSLKPPTIERPPRRWRLEDDRAARGLSGRASADDDAGPDRETEWAAVRAADPDEHGMLLRPGVHRGARPAAETALRVKSLGVARAVLGYRGYTREVSPDGEQPLSL